MVLFVGRPDQTLLRVSISKCADSLFDLKSCRFGLSISYSRHGIHTFSTRQLQLCDEYTFGHSRCVVSCRRRILSCRCCSGASWATPAGLYLATGSDMIAPSEASSLTTTPRHYAAGNCKALASKYLKPIQIMYPPMIDQN